MDRVRLGRVLGRGARLAARTAYEAMDAATTPTPSSYLPVVHRRPVVLERKSTRTPGGRAGIFTPLRRASRAVSLEVTGSFFALFAVSFGAGTWHARGLLRGGPHAVARFMAYAAIVCFFAYCAISNFWKARRLGTP